MISPQWAPSVSVLRPPMAVADSACVVIPTYNEAENIAALLQSIRMHAPGTQILVVDDQSPDGTAAVARRLAREDDQLHIVVRQGARGYGRASLEGLGWALARGADPIATIDADFSHDPARLPALLAAARDADVVIGSRYCPGGRILDWPLRRIVLSRLANAYVRGITGITTGDCTSGYRVYRRYVLQDILAHDIVSNQYAFLVELLLRAHWAGWTVRESPIVFADRRLGASKVSGKVLRDSLAAPIRLRWRQFRSPARKRSAPVTPLPTREQFSEFGTLRWSGRSAPPAVHTSLPTDQP